MVKCHCGKEIVFKGVEEREREEDEEEPRGLYDPKPEGGYSGGNPNAKKRKVRIYGCPDEFCIYTSDMTEDEYHELEDDENDEF